MTGYTPDELARYYDENPWDGQMPEELIVKTMGFQMAVLRYRINDLKNEIVATLPPPFRMPWNRLVEKSSDD